MKFTKMHGCGNDYIYINCLKETVVDPVAAAIHLSNQHFGVGADGLILVLPSSKADFRMRMFNADGSEGKMCGNGIRCLAKYVYDFGLTDKTSLLIETNAGEKSLELTLSHNKVVSVKVNMGSAKTETKSIPVISQKDSFINEPIQIGELTHFITCVSIGNPHAITYVPDIDALNLESIGPLFEHHNIFPERVNTEFIQVINRNEIKMRVWERGSGETLACGTGACAAVAASIINGFTDKDVLVHLRGGDLKIQLDNDTNTIYMTGPATTVFSGELYF